MSESENQFSLLKVHEWLAIIAIVGVIAGLTCLTSFQDNAASRIAKATWPETSAKGFDVLIHGAVRYPGIYHVESSIKLQDLLALAEVHPEADLRRFRLDQLVKRGRTIRVPLRQMIKVHLKGAVDAEQTLTVPKGTKMEELMGLISYDKNADQQALKKKRRLKDNEVILVPFLKEKIKKRGDDDESKCNPPRDR